jgi:hypothetical protein
VEIDDCALVVPQSLNQLNISTMERVAFFLYKGSIPGFLSPSGSTYDWSLDRVRSTFFRFLASKLITTGSEGDIGYFHVLMMTSLEVTASWGYKVIIVIEESYMSYEGTSNEATIS